MGIYAERVLPRLQDKVMSRKVHRDVRARICVGLSGDVLEVGFGTGLNVPFYPSEVTRVFVVEPSRVCLQLAEGRIARSDIPVEPAGITGERLDFPRETFDAVLSTWTLCTIPNLPAALDELLRVLKPGGAFHFVEHGHASDDKIARWQRRIEPLNKKLAGGCHLTRHIPEDIQRAGFRIEQLKSYYLEGVPKPYGWTFEGIASKT
jgi:ubiquinone/menaquinone biosynthesis C-methylase UbiE